MCAVSQRFTARVVANKDLINWQTDLYLNVFIIDLLSY